MSEIFQNALPPQLQADVRLPGIAPCASDDWLRVDEAYAAQMAYRAKLLAHKKADVLWMDPDALRAAQELLTEAMGILPALGFSRNEDTVQCPDGRAITLDWTSPLWTLGHLVQQDLCILEVRGDEHALTGAVLCFPASWRLSDKVGRPMTAIHEPVEEYDENIARRVQRMFDGVQIGKPLTRHNRLNYANSELHQPHPKIEQDDMPFVRSERQCLVRLPVSKAVVFSIHTFVVRG
jgi:hypothetical protein